MSSFILAAEYVADTVGLILYLEKSKLGNEAKKVFDVAENNQTIVHIPAMVLAEILYLSEKNRIKVSLADVAEHLKKHANFRECPMSQLIVEKASQIVDIPELHDRLIAATAFSLNAEIITTDTKIQASQFVKTIW